MRIVCLGVFLALFPACSEDKGGMVDAAGDPPDAFVDPADAPPSVDAPPVADSAPTGDVVYPDGVLVCGTKALYESCGDGSECQSCLCYTLSDTTYCSKSCLGPADCPAPSPGCNMLFMVCDPP
jgi:hypothetical protein